MRIYLLQLCLTLIMLPMKQNYLIEKNAIIQSNSKELCYILLAGVVAALIPTFFFYVGHNSSVIPLVRHLPLIKPICYLIGTANVIVLTSFLASLLKSMLKD